ncbi:replicative DNA helicase [uncultured Clostridium sp.]|uniref:replicative DNA helicase n=1 Tax=uncultured Clostridium sp. TaxID=59620 RepID=UPI0025D02116|nr:replicative DNA helicase [uncultured Clostridium sp.]
MGNTVQALPSNVLCEQELLSGIFYDTSILPEVIDKLHAEDFYMNSHQIIYSAIKKLFLNGQDINLTQLIETMDKDRIKEAGGISYVTELMVNGLKISPLQYVKILKEKSYRRSAIKAMKHAINNLYDEKTHSSDEIEKVMTTLMSRNENRNMVSKDSALLNRTVDEIQERVKWGNIIPGMKSGIDSIDKNIGGFVRGELDIISGRPSMGKTMFTLNIGDGLCRNGYKVFMCELEMTEKAIGMRRLSYSAMVEVEKMKFGRLTDEEISRIIAAQSEISERDSMYTDCSPYQDLLSIRIKAKSLKAMYGLDVIIIDHLSLMNIPKGQTRDAAIGEVTRGLKILAKELDVCVILICQLSRAVEQRNDKRPMLSDLRESGNIEQDADMVMFLYRDEYYNKYTKDRGIMECIIGKHRNGRIGTLKFKYDEKYQKISEI